MTHETLGGQPPHGAARGAADWLGLAATPTFAMMAVLAAISGGPPDMLCAAMQGSSALSGMVLMYALMGAFHVGPWLKLIAAARVSRGPDAGQCRWPRR
jgi:hypothetical protein